MEENQSYMHFSSFGTKYLNARTLTKKRFDRVCANRKLSKKFLMEELRPVVSEKIELLSDECFYDFKTPIYFGL